MAKHRVAVPGASSVELDDRDYLSYRQLAAIESALDSLVAETRDTRELLEAIRNATGDTVVELRHGKR